MPTSIKNEITIIVDKKEQKIEIDLDELIQKAKQRSLSNDDIQKILNYLLTR